jgi:HK97 family phage portal protein
VIVQTFTGLQAFTPAAPTWGSSGGSLQLYDYRHTYAHIYRTQPNVRICVDFLARNIAQLGLHVFRRVSDTDRVRLHDHELARWLGRPNPSTRRYRLIESLMGDLGVYFNAYLLKIRHIGDDGPAIGLVRLPADEIGPEGALLKAQFRWTANGRDRVFPVSEIVHLDGYNPTNPLMGLSPLETLRRILAEEAAAGEHREAFWRNAARVEGVVTRPKEQKRYNAEQVASWREQWQAAYAGVGGGGKTVLLQDGETFTPSSWSAKDSEYIAGGKLRREVCAAAYHIPLPLVGILEHATFSNIREQHKHLYQDCLGPWLELIQQEIEGQLLVECEDQRDVYVEFNIDEKLKGTPEERATSIQQSTGRPWRTVNEARALENLPRIDDPALDQVAPQQGGPATSTVTPAATAPNAERWATTVRACWSRQAARLQKHPVAERASQFDQRRWTRELASDLRPLFVAAGCADADADRRALEMASAINQETWERLAGDRDPFPLDRPVTVPRLAREEYSEA